MDNRFVGASIAVVVFAIFVTSSGAQPGGAGSSITQEELVRRTQELYDAVVPGNREPWNKYYADDCMIPNQANGGDYRIEP